jgi:oligopeptide transport system substrate-binding protein
MLFEGLTRLNVQEKVELALAESVSISEDMKTYTFELRPSSWSNGDPVTASDIAYAWRKVLDPQFRSAQADLLYCIKNGKACKEGVVPTQEAGVRVLGPRTLQVELEYPAPYFLELLASPLFFPVNQRVDEKHPAWSEAAATYVCNGPFILSVWKHRDQIILKKNRSYWDAQAVSLAEIRLPMVQEETELKMFENRELDWAGSPLSVLPVDALAHLKRSGTLRSKPFLATCFMRVNTKQAPFQEPLLRKAFAYAIDRKQIVEHVIQGDHLPATGLAPLSMGLQKKPYFNDGDTLLAKAYFQEGMQAAQTTFYDLPEISLIYAGGERAHRIAQAVQQQWREALGVLVRLEPLDSKVFFSRVAQRDYQLALGSWTADFNDPMNFLEVFKSREGGSNNTQWENAEYAKLLDIASMLRDAQARSALLARSEQILIDSMPIIPLYHYAMHFVAQEGVQDVAISSSGVVDFKWAKLVNR